MTNEEMAAALRAAGWRVAEPITQDNCPHLHKMGSGGISSDGSGFSEWTCQTCGKHERHEFPPNPRHDPLSIIPWNGVAA